MRIRNLRYFLIVAEELSFTKAAAIVHIEPSPLSRAIRELEAELGVYLLQRCKGRIQLTWAGEVFRDEAHRIISFMEGARSRVKSAAQGYRGRLRIGLTDNLAQPQLTRLLSLCREEDPLTEIRIKEMTVKAMINALEHDQIDAGITIHTEFNDRVLKQELWKERPCIAVPRNHPLLSFDKIPLHDLAKYPLILFHPELCAGGHNVIHRWFCGSTLSSLIIAEYVSGHETMMMLVAAGYGVGIGLSSQLKLYNNTHVILRLTTDDIPDTTTFIATLDRPHSDELDRFILRANNLATVF